MDSMHPVLQQRGHMGAGMNTAQLGLAAFDREGGFLIYNFTGEYNNEGFLG